VLTYPHFDPILLQLGPLAIRWYGVMYLLGFFMAWFLGQKRAKQTWTTCDFQDIDDMLFFAVLGVVFGGKIGYWLFYQPSMLLSHPQELLTLWHPGMSFHGGLLGVILALGIYAKRRQKNFFEVMDFVAPLVPLGLFFGRMGNFINGELWGRVTDSPIGMVFPYAGSLPRYPSQLIEALLEGLVLFAVVWSFSSKPRPTTQVSAVFLIGYAVARSISEYFRVPDPQYGYLAFNWLTMGQLLCLPMLLLGIGLYWQAHCRSKT